MVLQKLDKVLAHHPGAAKYADWNLVFHCVFLPRF
jgi:hypothetical protein